jgi:hypothetical protein
LQQRALAAVVVELTAAVMTLAGMHHVQQPVVLLALVVLVVGTEILQEMEQRIPVQAVAVVVVGLHHQSKQRLAEMALVELYLLSTFHLPL